MSQVWQLQDAKNKFSQVVENALADGPQIITRRGAEVAVVLSADDYRKMLAAQKPLSLFLRESPLYGVDLDLSREKGPARGDLSL
ncbi:MAG: type II toxin-antitoxin system Phd/YefM family antitoxin [Desulfobacteraceae bacterium]|nr:MAG: type II toxin-antitoxin system Phd/YefM family antitoxin [Desulfobacteraceae bacterium]